ncbi:MAG: TolC family protein [Myxococcales bacterium]|nr:TolC family protein [Myxococcales bacterium]MBK7196257.1 TolC family protein [Myxococcales bacterium]MBP6843210.1 TolC family protein [Kofleriaceae bacterium]
MRYAPIARLSAAALAMSHVPARADEVVLDLAAALARATTAAPATIAARGHTAEAQAARVGAQVRAANPALALGVGPRFAGDATVDLHLELAQPVGTGAPRRARLAVADAAIAHAAAEAREVERAARRATARAFVDALYAERLVATLADAVALAEHAAAVAARRRAAGDATDLDVDRARIAVGRARAAGHAAEAERARTLGELAGLIGLAADDTLRVTGALDVDPPLALAPLAAAADDRPELRRLDAEAALARAEARLAHADARPAVELSVAYDREADEQRVLGGVRVTWPLWDRGQGPAAIAGARATRVAAERAAAARAARREVADAFAVYQRARAAVAGFEADVLPALDDSEALVTRGVDAGTLTIADYLVARQELLDGRRAYLEHLRDRAQARVAALLAAEVTP